MFENRLRELEKNINLHYPKGEHKNTKEYFILTNEKNNREIYFRNTESAIKFIKHKLNTPKKKIIYSLIKMEVLLPFLKTIRLDSIFGDVIFIGEQIKCFDFNEKVVRSYPLYQNESKFFIKNKTFQMNLPREYSPVILNINKDIPCSKEELLELYGGEDYLMCFKKIYSYYQKNGITKNKDGFLITRIHGDFSKEQLLKRENEIVFTDWDSKKELITRDLYHFFRTDPNPFENKKFLEILNIYPEEVRMNIKRYMELNSKAWNIQLSNSMAWNKEQKEHNKNYKWS